MFNKRLFAVLLGACLVCMFAGDVMAQWEDVFVLGDPGRGWPLDGVGGGPDVDFIQEIAVNPPPGNPANTGGEGGDRDVDDDYYFAGTYPDAPTGVGAVATDETAMERAFAGEDLDLRIHFNLPSDLHPDDKFRITTNPINLHDDGGDTRYGVEFLFNGSLVKPEVVVRPADLNTLIVSAEFTAGDVGAIGGAGIDNIINIHGVSHNDDGGGNWMGMDYHRLERNPVPEPGSLSMLLCGIFWMIPLVCWEKKFGAK